MKCKWICEERYNEFKGKTILVAGGTGFVGKRAVEIFAALGMEVYVITRKNRNNLGSIHYIQADLLKIEDLLSLCLHNKYDYGVYMAAHIPLREQAKEDYYDAKVSTFDPFINFCKGCIPYIQRFVYISSVDVLGGCDKFEYDENAEVGVATPYGLAKYIGEFYTSNICKILGIPYSILRFAQIYGPNEPVVRVIPVIKQAMLNSETFTLITDGNEKRRFLFIDDAVKAILHGLMYAKSGTYNIAGPDVISMKDLVSLIESTWNRHIELIVENVVIGKDNVPSFDKAKNEIYFIPDIDIRTGIQIVKEIEQDA